MITLGIGTIAYSALSKRRSFFLGVGLALAVVAQSSASLSEEISSQEMMEAMIRPH